jgi:hypothetical protein
MRMRTKRKTNATKGRVGHGGVQTVQSVRIQFSAFIFVDELYGVCRFDREYKERRARRNGGFECGSSPDAPVL